MEEIKSEAGQESNNTVINLLAQILKEVKEIKQDIAEIKSNNQKVTTYKNNFLNKSNKSPVVVTPIKKVDPLHIKPQTTQPKQTRSPAVKKHNAPKKHPYSEFKASSPQKLSKTTNEMHEPFNFNTEAPQSNRVIGLEIKDKFLRDSCFPFSKN